MEKVDDRKQQVGTVFSTLLYAECMCQLGLLILELPHSRSSLPQVMYMNR